MTQWLVIGFEKAIRGKSLSKNIPTCENTAAQAQYGSYGLQLIFDILKRLTFISVVVWRKLRNNRKK